MATYRVEALDRGLQVLGLFTESQRQLRLTDISQRTGIPMPTAFRYVKTLEARGYLEVGADGQIRPGPSVMTLGFAALRGMDLLDVAREPLHRLASQTQETVNLGVLLESQVLYIHRIRNADLVTAAVQVGSVLPAACTSIGKMLLSHMDEGEIRRRVGDSLDKGCAGPAAYSDISALVEHLRETRERGWSLQDQEIAHGALSIAAPVAREGQVIAGINIAVNASVWSRSDLIEKLLPPLLETSETISSVLG